MDDTKMIQRLRLTSDRAIYRTGYIHALTDLVRLVERMDKGQILCNPDNLIEFIETQMYNSQSIAQREVTK